MMLKSVIIALVASASAAPALAHWQYTKWDMKPVQVVQASKGAAREVLPSDVEELPYGTKLAVGSYTSGSRSFKASFWFKNKGLARVNLSTENADDCFAVKRDLLNVYGEPLSQSRGLIETSVWSDKPKGNRVQFSNWATGGCDLIYTPLPTAQNTGL